MRFTARAFAAGLFKMVMALGSSEALSTASSNSNVSVLSFKLRSKPTRVGLVMSSTKLSASLASSTGITTATLSALSLTKLYPNDIQQLLMSEHNPRCS